MEWAKTFYELPQTLRLRKLIFQVHLWMGIIIGLYVIAISISGSAIVFSSYMEDSTPKLAEAGGKDGRSISYDRMASIARAELPGYQVGAISSPIWQGRATIIRMQKDKQGALVFLDPRTSSVLGKRIGNAEEKHPILRFLRNLHFNLLSGRTGGKVNGILAGLLLVMCLTGVVIWWPGKRNWRRSLKVNWKATWKRVNWDLHSAIGFWTLLLVAMWAVSGVYLCFPVLLRRSFARVLPVEERREFPKTEWKPGMPMAPLDVFVRETQDMLPKTIVASVFFPSAARSVVIVDSYSATETWPTATAYRRAFLDPSTGKILQVTGTTDERAGGIIYRWLQSLHYGTFGGGRFGRAGYYAVKILWVPLGVAPAALFITGFLMYWNRVLSKKWAALRNSSKPNPKERTGSEFANPLPRKGSPEREEKYQTLACKSQRQSDL